MRQILSSTCPGEVHLDIHMCRPLLWPRRRTGLPALFHLLNAVHSLSHTQDRRIWRSAAARAGPPGNSRRPSNPAWHLRQGRLYGARFMALSRPSWQVLHRRRTTGAEGPVGPFPARVATPSDAKPPRHGRISDSAAGGTRGSRHGHSLRMTSGRTTQSGAAASRFAGEQSREFPQDHLGANSKGGIESRRKPRRPHCCAARPRSGIENHRWRAAVAVRLDGTRRGGSGFDIDLLAAFDEARPLSLPDVIRIEGQLADLLRQPVDLIEEGTIKPHVRQNVDCELVRAL